MTSQTLNMLSRRSHALTKLMSPYAKMPVYILMFVTSRCDAKCHHCSVWDKLNQKVREELTLDEIENLAKSIGPTIQVTLTGGSPELRPDLAEVAQVFYRHCCPVNMTLCMNGYHTGKIVNHAEKILQTCPNQKLTVGISLDGLGEEHDRLRRMPGLFNRVVETIHALGELKPFYPGLRIASAICVTSLNCHTAEATVRWARENLPIDLLKPILIRGNPKELSPLDRASKEAYDRIVAYDDQNLRDKQGLLSYGYAFAVNAKEMAQRELIQEMYEAGSSPVCCSAARETAVIYPRGTVMGCESRPDELGNLRDVGMDLSRIWFSDEADAFRSKIRKEGCKCCHHCFIAPSIFRSPQLWNKVAKSSWKIWRSNSTIKPNTVKSPSPAL